MKKQALLWIVLACLVSSCSKRELTNEGNAVKTIVFNKEVATPIAESSFLIHKKEIPLQTIDKSLLAGYPAMAIDREDLFIYNKYKPQVVFRFGMDGLFKNTIGRIGNGPEEFTEYYDIYLNKKNKQVEILTNAGMYNYQYDGQFIRKTEQSIPALSFAIAQDSIYWLHTGNNDWYSPHKLFKTNERFTTLTGYLEDGSRTLPTVEINFGKESYLTYRESLHNQLYRILGNTITQSYDVKFPGMEIPKSLLQSDPMEMLPQLAKLNYAMVSAYFENKDFLFLCIMENREHDEIHFYYWITDKRNQNEKIIEVEQVTPDSYLLSPQFLTENNLLYFIGYPNEHPDDVVNPDANPSVFLIDLEKIF